MTEQLWTKVDCYFADMLAPSDAALDAALEASAAAGLPTINVAPSQGSCSFWRASRARETS